VSLSKQGLSYWLTSPEGVEPDDVGVQIDLGSDKPVRPGGVEGEGVAQQCGSPLVIGTPQEDEAAVRGSRQVAGPLLGERAASRRTVEPGGGPAAAGRDELGRLDLQRRQGLVVEARPDLRLPAYGVLRQSSTLLSVSIPLDRASCAL
jgi:hypothetical protein